MKWLYKLRYYLNDLPDKKPGDILLCKKTKFNKNDVIFFIPTQIYDTECVLIKEEYLCKLTLNEVFEYTDY